MTSKKKRSSRGQLLGAAIVAGTAAMVVMAVLYGAPLLMAQPRAVTEIAPKPSAAASMVAAASTSIIVSAPNSNDCRGYQLNIVTGERGDKGRVDCDTGISKPGRLETIAKSFRNR